jgi:RimJ/RimL family protein N-acetyltransferase
MFMLRRLMFTRTVLESKRLRLREFEAADEAAVVRMHRDARVRALVLDDYPLDRAPVAAFFIRRLATIYRDEEGLGIWHAEHRVADAWRFCGWFNLMRMPDDPSRVEIGCRLLPEVWGRGLAIEGGQLLLRHAFDTLALAEVWGICRPQHQAVHAVLAALGFDDAGVHDYDAQPATHFVIDAQRWRAACTRPLRLRLRDAVRRSRDAPAGADAQAAA